MCIWTSLRTWPTRSVAATSVSSLQLMVKSSSFFLRLNQFSDNLRTFLSRSLIIAHRGRRISSLCLSVSLHTLLCYLSPQYSWMLPSHRWPGHRNKRSYYVNLSWSRFGQYPTLELPFSPSSLLCCPKSLHQIHACVFCSENDSHHVYSIQSAVHWKFITIKLWEIALHFKWCCCMRC